MQMHPGNRNSIPRRIVDSVIGKCCPICLEDVEIRSAAVLGACMHAYCLRCILRWSCLKRRCPVCQRSFSSWFCKVNPSDETFREQKLLPEAKGKTICSIVPYRPERVLWRQRSRLYRQQRRQSQNKQLPRRRSFRQATEGVDVVCERVEQWRASIYENRIPAVPLTRNAVKQKFLGKSGAEEAILRRIEPWIWRELKAVLKDPDPTVIVHVVTSLFLSKCDKFDESVEYDVLTPLRCFLHEHTDLFWHELRKFTFHGGI